MKPTGFLNRSKFLLLAGGLSACAVGPNFHAPKAPDVPLTPAPLPVATQAAAGQAQNFILAGDISGDWWNLYHSQELNALIAQAFVHNPSLQAAQATLREAEENTRAGEGALLPSISGSFQDQRQRNSSAPSKAQGFSVPAPQPYTLYNASLSVSYAFDIFGGARRQVENLAAKVTYQHDELEAAYLALSANIVTAAINEAALHAQIDDTNAIIANQQHELTILNAQVSLGGAAAANVLQQQASLAAEEATLPPLQSQLAQLRNQLAAYVGAFPGNFHASDFTLQSLHLPQDVPVSLPSVLVAQRPDIAAAAAQMHSAMALLGVADANMLPKITLTADVGHEGLSPATLFTPQTLLWSLAAGITQPIFEGGTLTAQRKAAVAALQVAAAQYQGVVIGAFQNVADVLSALQYDALTLGAAQTAADAAAKSLAVTQDQYRLGAVPFTAVLSAQTSYQNAAITLVKASATRLADTAALFQAMGGGWWHRNDVSAPCCGLIP
ncbi:MAG: RND transporter [Acidocella sp. 20-63-7]|nr:MAG: RND transporter [Acidocella sp. 20-63-7]HQT45707.1 efflux transporter outer membrane subunit [Acidocella sp.]